MQPNGIQAFRAPITGAITAPNHVIRVISAVSLGQGRAMIAKGSNHYGACAFLRRANHRAQARRALPHARWHEAATGSAGRAS